MARPMPGPDRDPGGGGPEPELPGPGGPSPRTPRRRPTRGGVAVVSGGLLQDLEDRLRRDLAPVEERVRPGEELRALAGEPGRGVGDPLVITLPTRAPTDAPG